MKFHPLFLGFLMLLFSCQDSFNKKKIVANQTKGTDFLEKARGYFFSHKDSAYYYSNLGYKEFLQTKDTINMAKCLIIQGSMLVEYGDYHGGIERCSTAGNLVISKKDSIGKVLHHRINNTIGLANANLNEHEQSIYWFKKALVSAESKEDKLMIYNNMGSAFMDQKKYDLAINSFEKAHSLIDSTTAAYLKLMCEDNMHFSRWKLDSNYPLIEKLNQNLALKEKIQDTNGQYATYANQVRFYQQKKDPINALKSAKKQLEYAIKCKHKPSEIESYALLGELSNGQESKNHYQKFKKLSDSLRVANENTLHRFASIRYDSEKNRIENLQLQADNAEKKLALIWQLVLLGGGILTLSIVLYFVYQKRKKDRIQLTHQKELEIKETELKYTKAVHDVVANGIYKMMVKAEHAREKNHHRLIEDLEEIYEKSRNISKLGVYHSGKAFSEQVKDLFLNFHSQNLKIALIGNEEAIWNSVSKEVKEELFLIFQELLTNTQKYSKASRVILKVIPVQDNIEIQYQDNGIGLTEENLKSRNGLYYIKTRVEGFKGKINFESPEIGMKLTIKCIKNHV